MLMHVRRCSINMYIEDMAECSKINSFIKKGSQPSLVKCLFSIRDLGSKFSTNLIILFCVV